MSGENHEGNKSPDICDNDNQSLLQTDLLQCFELGMVIIDACTEDEIETCSETTAISVQLVVAPMKAENTKPHCFTIF
jgi:hypothetical protein